MADISALLAPLIMAIAFVAVVRTIIVSQNPRKRAAARAWEAAAERADPRFAVAPAVRPVRGSDPTTGSGSDSH